MKKILIIEDDEFLQGLEATKIKNSGYEVITAINGEDGMRRISDSKVDLVLLDLLLPNYDGFQILKKIREGELNKNIPVIVFSNLSEKSDIDKANGLGATRFMIKSNFSLEELVEYINKILLK
ncbi:MAG: response regulator [Candidatus Nomurabacteria bacterium]